MNTPVIFSEKQRFNQGWLWLILMATVGITIFTFIQKLPQKTIVGISTNALWDLFWSLLPLILIVVFIFSIRLTTQIKEEGIYVKLFPIQFKFLFFPWEQLEKVYVRKYAPIREYGGWGLRLGIFGSGKAYNIKGNKGLQLVLKDGEKLLIGTQMPEALEHTLISMDRQRI